MPVILALAGAFVIAAVVELGTKAGADAALMFRLVALPVFAGVIILAVVLYHKRKTHEHIVARYRLDGEQKQQRRVSLLGRKVVWICRDCGDPLVDLKAQETHLAHHQYVWGLSDRVLELERLIAEARGGVPVEPVKEPPWTAVVEDATAPETVTEHEQAPQIEEEEPRFARFREAMERING